MLSRKTAALVFLIQRSCVPSTGTNSGSPVVSMSSAGTVLVKTWGSSPFSRSAVSSASSEKRSTCPLATAALLLGVGSVGQLRRDRPGAVERGRLDPPLPEADVVASAAVLKEERSGVDHAEKPRGARPPQHGLSVNQYQDGRPGAEDDPGRAVLESHSFGLLLGVQDRDTGLEPLEIDRLHVIGEVGSQDGEVTLALVGFCREARPGHGDILQRDHAVLLVDQGPRSDPDDAVHGLRRDAVRDGHRRARHGPHAVPLLELGLVDREGQPFALKRAGPALGIVGRWLRVRQGRVEVDRVVLGCSATGKQGAEARGGDQPQEHGGGSDPAVVDHVRDSSRARIPWACLGSVIEGLAPGGAVENLADRLTPGGGREVEWQPSTAKYAHNVPAPRTLLGRLVLALQKPAAEFRSAGNPDAGLQCSARRRGSRARVRSLACSRSARVAWPWRVKAHERIGAATRAAIACRRRDLSWERAPAPVAPSPLMAPRVRWAPTSDSSAMR